MSELTLKTRLKPGKSKFWRAVSLIFLSIVCAMVVFPIVLTFLYSFFPVSEITSYLGKRARFEDDKWLNLVLAPAIASLRQYYGLLIEKPMYLKLFFNSVFYTVSILFGQMLIIPACAYALSFFKFKGRESLFFVILMMMLLPFQVTMAPSVLTMRFLGIMETTWAVILPIVFSPFYIFLVRQYMLSIPTSLMEAAVVDGAGTIRCFFHVALPIAKPILGAALALSFADCWNLVEQPLVYLRDMTDKMPLSVMFNTLSTDEMGVVFAGAALYILPALLVYRYFQEDILLGIQLSNMK